MIIGTIQILVAQQLGIVLSGLILGCVVFSLQFLVNHLTNPDSFCILNDLENYYREEIGLPKVTGFLPRYYAKLKEIKDILKV